MVGGWGDGGRKFSGKAPHLFTLSGVHFFSFQNVGKLFLWNRSYLLQEQSLFWCPKTC